MYNISIMRSVTWKSDEDWHLVDLSGRHKWTFLAACRTFEISIMMGAPRRARTQLARFFTRLRAANAREPKRREFSLHTHIMKVHRVELIANRSVISGINNC